MFCFSSSSFCFCSHCWHQRKERNRSRDQLSTSIIYLSWNWEYGLQLCLKTKFKRTYPWQSMDSGSSGKATQLGSCQQGWDKAPPEQVGKLSALGWTSRTESPALHPARLWDPQQLHSLLHTPSAVSQAVHPHRWMLLDSTGRQLML